jgi:hypothetical protein
MFSFAGQSELQEILSRGALSAMAHLLDAPFLGALY